MTPINASNMISSATSTSTAIESPTTQTRVGEEFNSFIKLLTAQLRNQDPLSPLDSTQFVEQLATFSSLEQQVTSNQKLDSIALRLDDLNAFLANGWLQMGIGDTTG